MSMASVPFVTGFGVLFSLTADGAAECTGPDCRRGDGAGGRGAGRCTGWDLLSQPLSSGHISFSPPSWLIN